VLLLQRYRTEFVAAMLLLSGSDMVASYGKWFAVCQMRGGERSGLVCWYGGVVVCWCDGVLEW